MGHSDNPVMLFNLASLVPRRHDLEILVDPFTAAKIEAIIHSLPSDKKLWVPMDPMVFSQKMLKHHKNNFLRLYLDFSNSNIDLLVINKSFITLIPKVDSSKIASDFRHISLCNCVLKVITKVLAYRLQKFILDIIHKNQYGFIKGRSIQVSYESEIGLTFSYN
jgi:hypothetical protein